MSFNSTNARTPSLKVTGQQNNRLVPLLLANDVAANLVRRDAGRLLQAEHVAGKLVANGAVAFLFAVVDTHVAVFHLGDADQGLARAAQVLLDGYKAHFDYLLDEGVITANNEEGLFVAYGTGRAIQRTDEKSGTVVYRALETHRTLEIASGNLTRLVAGA